MKHFDKLAIIVQASKLKNSLPDGSRGPEDMFIAGASYMHKLMRDEADDLRAEVERLRAYLAKEHE